MANVMERSARNELKAIIEAALAKETGLPDGASRRIVNRILRQSGRIAEVSAAFRAAAPTVMVDVACAPAFDPYEIGAVVTLQRSGPEALLERLSSIESVDNLRSLAVAQNLALRVDCASADELRNAILHGAEQRLAERRAAAS